MRYTSVCDAWPMLYPTHNVLLDCRAATKLHCLVTEADVLAQGCTRQHCGWELNSWFPSPRISAVPTHPCISCCLVKTLLIVLMVCVQRLQSLTFERESLHFATKFSCSCWCRLCLSRCSSLLTSPATKDEGGSICPSMKCRSSDEARDITALQQNVPLLQV